MKERERWRKESTLGVSVSIYEDKGEIKKDRGKDKGTFLEEKWTE